MKQDLLIGINDMITIKKVIILTGTEQRHTFIRKAISLDKNINVLKSYCEDQSEFLGKIIQVNKDISQVTHLKARAKSEEDFFSYFNKLTPDISNPIKIEKGDINKNKYIEEIISLDPDLVIAFGCSLIKPRLINHFNKRFVNIHLGLSPYYRGSGTNFFPLLNNEPEYIGVTFMYIDEGVDTGEIIHQFRARVVTGDTPHQIGNRLISDVAGDIINIIINFNTLENITQPKKTKYGKYYIQKDFTPEAVVKVYSNFDNGLVDEYLKIKDVDKVFLFENPAILRLK